MPYIFILFIPQQHDNMVPPTKQSEKLIFTNTAIGSHID